MMLEKVFFLAVLAFVLGDFLVLSDYLTGVNLKVVVVIPFCLVVCAWVRKNLDIRFCYAIFVVIFLFMGFLVGSNVHKVSDDSILHFVEQRGIVTGEVVYNSWQSYDNGYAGFVLQVQSFTVGEKTVIASGKLKVRLSKVPESVQFTAGSIISLGGEIKTLTTLYNPGSKNMIDYNYRQDIYGRITAKYDNVAVVERKTFFSELEKFLQKTKYNMQQVMPKDDQSVLLAMIFGGYTDIDDITIESFSTVGLIHILSVSGAHVAMLVGFVLWLTGKVRLGRKKSTILAVFFISFYAVLCGLSVPVVRSVIMGIALLIGLLLDRKANVSNILGIICILFLLYEPRWLFDITFQLSFLAVAGLFYLSPRIQEKLAFLPDFISTGLAITLAVQIATLPFIAFYFYKISLLAAIANILILPLLELCLLFSLFALFFYMLAPIIGSFVFICSSLLLGVAVRLAEFLAGFDFALFFIPYLPEWFWICYYIVVLICFSLLPLSFSGKVRKVVLTSFLVFVSIFAVVNSTGNQFSVHFIDVGQGDACLVITPNKKAILLDTGVKSDYSDYDAGKQIIVPYLRHYGIKKINLMVLSHGHNDHAGGAASIAKQIPVRELWLPNEEASSSVERLLAVAKDSNKLTMDDKQTAIIDGVEVKVIYAADLGYLPKKKNNETSAVVKVSYANKSFLFTGDATQEIEQKITTLLDKIDVLKVSHHGAKSSSDEAFIKKIKPDIAVISVAANNVYGHPALKTLKTLYKNGSKVARTDHDGAVLVKLENDKLVWYGYRKNPRVF